MKLGNVTLARILGPEPQDEFRECARCGVGLPVKREDTECADCAGVNAYQPFPRQLGNGSFLPVDPAYEVSLHYPKQAKECPTMKTLDALHMPYFNYMATSDPLAVAWALELITSKESEPVDYPIVVITSHGQYVEHWTGFQLAKLNLIPTARDLTINNIQLANTYPGVPIREREAA